jgi:hypothetical protein
LHTRQKSRDFYVGTQRATAGNSYWRQAYGIGESQGLAADEGDSIEPTGWAVPTKGGVRAGPTEVFLEARETTLLVEHKADEDPHRNLAGCGIGLQGFKEPASAQIGSRQNSNEPTSHPNGVFQLVMTRGIPNPIFATPDGHLGREGIVSGDTAITEPNKKPARDIAGVQRSTIRAAGVRIEHPAQQLCLPPTEGDIPCGGKSMR